MKKTELEAGIEYAIYGTRSRWKATRGKFTAEQIENAKGGEIVGSVFEFGWNRNWDWRTKKIQLNQIQESWEAYEKEEERKKVLAEQNRKRTEEARAITQAQAEELRQYLEQNGARLTELLGKKYSHSWGNPEIEIRLNREQIEALLERIG